MYRLLIVDDEPYTVDGLFEILQDAPGLPEMELYKAYAAEEALACLNRVKVDVVVSDIRMPGMDGLELHRSIRARWPLCKVIFLTGLNDADVVRQAMRGGGADYLLKTEGDAPILDAIRAAFEAIERELTNDRFLATAKARLRQALPAMRNDWFRRLLHYGVEEHGVPQAKLDELESPLSADAPALPIVARVDRWPDGSTAADRSLLLYAIENIAAELLASVRMQWIAADETYFVLLVQPGAGAAADEAAWAQTVKFAQGTLETVQAACSRLLKLTVSAVCGREPLPWEAVPEACYAMRKSLVVGVGDGRSMMLLSRSGEKPPCGDARDEAAAARHRERLEAALETGDIEGARSAIEAGFEDVAAYAAYVETYYAAANRLLSLANRWGVAERKDTGVRIDDLMDLRAHQSRDQAVRCLQDAAERLLRARRNVQDERAQRIVDKVDRCIRERIREDVSLTALAEAVYLNPTYLSMLYKQIKGTNISDTIQQVRLERAKELLADPRLKIHEVAAAVGLDNPGYFTRFFRKHAGVSPQEYRNASAPR
ncbi:response regulator [Paenibacillus sp.]|uniref:response regulator n=1 Tax=Paenibacillus sp. TaxID=58172 RepID=UPI002D334DC6|nr:response regulator [Paenibacillus sp.]HZG88181.1 response regulator [Paenibacillus sp.]